MANLIVPLRLPTGQVKRLILPAGGATDQEWAKILETQWPELITKCCPRIYETSQDYASSKLVGTRLATSAVNRCAAVSAGINEDATGVEFLIANQLVRFGVPTYFLSRELAQAIRQTKPPMALEWHDMHLPFEAAVFMLPRNTLRHATEGDCNYITYARYRIGDIFTSPLVGGACASVLGGFMLLASAGRLAYHYYWPYQGHRPMPIIQLGDLDAAMTGSDDHTERLFFPEGMSDDDTTFLREAAHYVFGALLIMLNRPDLVQRGQMIRRVHKNGKQPREFWSPNYIGANYRVVRSHEAAAAGSGTSPRMHWRRGHWRHQPCGPQRNQRRDIWIEPMLINAD